MKLLPGFREFYPEECARKNYLIANWRKVARRYGFAEVDGPVLEPYELFEKKSGGEIAGQLFDFIDKGERHVTLRPEMTPTLARMVITRERDFRKPIKWFSIAQFFRYEKQQRGRLREFLQLNCDLIGDASPAADAEILALLIDLLRVLGLTEKDFVLRLSDRQAWIDFFKTKNADISEITDFLAIIDKWERDSPEILTQKLKKFQFSFEEVQAFIEHPTQNSAYLQSIAENLNQRGFSGFFEIDLTIVRGLAYYNGLVFEIFDRNRKLRAVAGGGRYDKLIHLMSDGRVDLPAIGFGIGDVVLGELIDMAEAAGQQATDAVQQINALDTFVIVADETYRQAALKIVQQLRNAGFKTDYPLDTTKVAKQFKQAEQSGATHAIIVGSEYPQIKVKDLAQRKEKELPDSELINYLKFV